MRIILFVGAAKYPPVTDVAVSGHVQIALKTAEILRGQSHDVTLVTSEAPPGYRIPPIVNLDGTDVRTIVHGVTPWPDQRVNLATSAIQFRQLHMIVRGGGWDALHFVGTSRTATLLGLLIIAARFRGKSVATLVDVRVPSNTLYRTVQRRSLARIDRFLTLTNYTKNKLMEEGVERVSLTRPGVLKHRSGQTPIVTFRSESSGYVLFWRNANRANGADICAEVFERLSRELEVYDFVFAVRPGDELEGLLINLAERYRNIHLMCHPYGNGIDIYRLISSAACVLLPFRWLSMQPQFAVLETLLANKPLITTIVGSNTELIEHGRTGFLVDPTDIEQMCSYVKYLLENRAFASKMGETAGAETAQNWNWPAYAESLAKVYSNL